MSEKIQLVEEMTCGPAKIRIDVLGDTTREHVLDDMSFMNYRLADVTLSQEPTLPTADIVIQPAGAKEISYDGRVMTFSGDWPAGPIQKAIVALLALKLEDHGLHPCHSSAVRYRGKSVLFLGGESNHGKTMGQIEGCKRGGELISTETTVIDESGVAVMGSKSVFLKKRTEGTERADKAAPEAGVAKFFGDMPTWEQFDRLAPIDVVIVPAIDGNFATNTVEMGPFEKQFQTLHSLQNYFLLNELLAPGFPIPLVDTEERRRRRAAFIARFCERPYYFVRAANPQLLMDEVDKVL
jgi:hypothetical protein